MNKIEASLCFFIVVVASFCMGLNISYQYAVDESLIITYAQQEEDRHLCERDIKRSEQCVPVIMWLPEAESEVKAR